jgi:large subunit ribosomal protein L21
MYAVIASGGKQYRVAEGQVIKLEKIAMEVGQVVDFDEVLMLSSESGVEVGAPFIVGATVKAEIVEQGRAKKIEILKFKRRKHHMKHMGHRQSYTTVKIQSIEEK